MVGLGVALFKLKVVYVACNENLRSKFSLSNKVARCMASCVKNGDLGMGTKSL